MASGVKVQEGCAKYFNDLKMNKSYRWVVFKITDNLKEIEVECTGDPERTYDELVEVFKAAEEKRECRYAVYDADFEVKDGHRKKIVFFTWSPDTATVKQKMLYSSSKDALKKQLIGINKEIQTCDHGDLCWSSVLENLVRNEK